MPNTPKTLIQLPIVRSLCESVVEISEQWYSENESSQTFYDLFADQVGGYPGIHNFKIDLAVELEEQVLKAGGWDKITTVWDDLISQIIMWVFNNMLNYGEIDKLLEDTKEYIRKLIEKEIEDV